MGPILVRTILIITLLEGSLNTVRIKITQGNLSPKRKANGGPIQRLQVLPFPKGNCKKYLEESMAVMPRI